MPVDERTPAAQAWLDEYAANTKDNAPNAIGPDDSAPPTGDGTADDGAGETPPQTTETPAPSADPPPADPIVPDEVIPPPPPLPKPPPLPRPPGLPSPPRVKIGGDESKRGASDWRDKYKSGPSGNGREQTCVVLGGYWLGMLKSMSDSLKQAKVDPMIDYESLGPAIVLTLDEVLPDTVEITPKMMAVGGSSLLLMQRFLNREAIAKAQAVEKDRAEHAKWKEDHARQAERGPEPVPPPRSAEGTIPAAAPEIPIEVVEREPSVAFGFDPDRDIV